MDSLPARDDARGSALVRLHPITLLLEIPSLLVRWVGPFVLIGLVGSHPETFFSRTFRFAIVGAAIGTTAALLRYATVRYGILDRHLVIRSGLLHRRTRSVPLVQIHNVDLRTRPLQRLLGVCEVRVETAGGHQAEAHLRVVGVDDAQRLRRAVLHHDVSHRDVSHKDLPHRAVLPGDEGGATEDPDHAAIAYVDPASVDPAPDPAVDTPSGDERPIWKIGLRELLLAGATGNRVGPIAALLVGLQEILDDSGFDVPRAIESVVLRFLGQGTTSTLLILGSISILFLVAGWLVSIAMSWITYHGFTLERSGVELRRSHGLLSRFEALVSVPRVQVLLLESTWLRRWIGYVAIRVQTAGSPKKGAGGSAVLFPLLPRRDAPALGRWVFPELEIDEAALLPVHPRSLRRGFVRYLLGLVAIVGAAAIAKGPLVLLLMVAAPIPAWALARARYRALGYHLGDRFLLVRAGVLTRNLWVIPVERIQTIAWKQNPFQRFAGLASLTVDTAGAASWSAATIVDLGERDAGDLWLRLASVAETANLREDTDVV